MFILESLKTNFDEKVNAFAEFVEIAVKMLITRPSVIGFLL